MQPKAFNRMTGRGVWVQSQKPLRVNSAHHPASPERFMRGQYIRSLNLFLVWLEVYPEAIRGVEFSIWDMRGEGRGSLEIISLPTLSPR
nr:hypothetical protein BgiMline_031122 [Biomphalaria glabrata]